MINTDKETDTNNASDPLEDFYLWHLREIGVLDQGCKSSLWQKICTNKRPPVRVAIIDSGIDIDHPNLNSFDTSKPWEQIDFTPYLYGAKYDPPLKSIKRYLDARSRPKPHDATEMSKLRQAVYDELENWSKRLDFDIDILKATLKTTESSDDDAAFYQALVGNSDFSGGISFDAKNHGPTDGTTMLPDASSSGFKKMQKIIDELGDGAIDQTLEELWDDLKDKHTINIPCKDPSCYFGAHGTACAGLIGGRPANSKTRSSKDLSLRGQMEYFGVNPYCELLSIATPYSHEVLPMIHALIYAVVHGASVIHIPRGLPDYMDRIGKMKDTHFSTRIDRPVGIKNSELSEAEVDAIRGLASGDEKAERDVSLPEDQADLYRLMLHSKMFERLLIKISNIEGIYVVLSAGNDGWGSRLSYPARIHNKDEDNLFVVGAVNRKAYKPPPGKKWSDYISSYSNGRENFDKLDIYHVLCDDGFALDQKRVAFDERSRHANDYNYNPHLPVGLQNSYSGWGLLTLDVRGSYGYAAGKRFDPPESDNGEEIGALYTLFGGTSGASALMAGMISLLLQADDNDGLSKLRTGEPVKL